MRIAPLCLLLPALVLAACNASGDAGPAPAAGLAAQAPVLVAAKVQQPEGPAAAQLAAMRLNEVLRLEIMHDYFADGRCSACRVAPSADTATMLRRAVAVFRAKGGRVLVAAPSADLLGERLTFEVHASDRVLAAVTTTGAPGLSPEVVAVSFPSQLQAGAWAIVEVAVDADATLPVLATVAFSSREVRWRWIIVPGEAVESLAGWTVRRKSDPHAPVDHDPPEAIDLQDGRQAWQIALRAPLPLRERQPADRIFMLVPPPGEHSGPILLPSPAPDGLRQTPSGDPIVEIFVFL